MDPDSALHGCKDTLVVRPLNDNPSLSGLALDFLDSLMSFLAERNMPARIDDIDVANSQADDADEVILEMYGNTVTLNRSKEMIALRAKLGKDVRSMTFHQNKVTAVTMTEAGQEASNVPIAMQNSKKRKKSRSNKIPPPLPPSGAEPSPPQSPPPPPPPSGGDGTRGTIPPGDAGGVTPDAGGVTPEACSRRRWSRGLQCVERRQQC